MCKSCEMISKMTGDVIDVIMDMHKQSGVEPSPASVTEGLEIIFSKISAEVMMSFAQAMIGKIAIDLGLPENATKAQIAQELVKQSNAGTLPEGLQGAVIKAKELVDALSGREDDEPNSSDILN